LQPVNKGKDDMSELTKEAPQVPASGLGRYWGRIVVWSGLVALFAVVGFSLYNNNLDPTAQGKRAPDFTLVTFDGETISSEALRGKVVVINFWASWCKPCEQEAADLEMAWRYYQPRGDVVFLGVGYIDTEPEALAYLDKFDISYPNGPDLRTRISKSFRIIGVPETFVIDQSGILVNKKIGPYISLQEILSMIDPLLD
jgi:cytochrome c biogenesis protein CcmG, thiol:disulfide interchange protein DsbE